MQPNTALPSSLRQSSNHCKAPTRAVPVQGAATRHTQSLDPNRRPYTTDRLFSTQTTRHNTLVPARVPGPVPQCATMRQLQFQSQRAMKFTNCKTQSASQVARTHELVLSPHKRRLSHGQTSSVQSPSGRLDSSSTNKSLFPFTHQHVVTQNAADTSAPKPVDVVGPSDLRIHVRVLSPQASSRRLRLRAVPSPAVGPRTGLFTASCCICRRCCFYVGKGTIPSALGRGSLSSNGVSIR